MSVWLIPTIAAVLALALGVGLGFWIRSYVVRGKVRKQEDLAEQRLGAADQKASEIVLAARDEALELRNEVERELERRRASLRREEERVQASNQPPLNRLYLRLRRGSCHSAPVNRSGSPAPLCQ